MEHNKLWSLCQEKFLKKGEIVMLTFDAEIASEVGVNVAIVINQLHYWTERGMGRVIDNKTYIYNTFEDWQKQFPFWCLRTVKSIFKKLVENDLVFTTKRGYDRTSHFSLNYSHPIMQKLHDRKCKSCTIESAKVARSIHTKITTNKTNKSLQRRTTPLYLKKEEQQTTLVRVEKEKTYRREFSEAKEWISLQSDDFKKELNEYVDYHTNSPNVVYPNAFRMSVLVEVWRKYTGQIHHTDFRYVDKSKFIPTVGMQFKNSTRAKYLDEFDKEMLLNQEEECSYGQG